MANLYNLQCYIADAVEAVEFKLIRSRDDIEDESIKFQPAMAHQIFGEHEHIFGYKDLKVTIMYTAGALQIYIGTRYSGRVEDCNFDDVRADNIIEIITSKFPNDGCYFTNIDEFVKILEKEKSFKPFGEKLTEYRTEDATGKLRHFEIYYSDYNTPKFPVFFSRLQTFVLWFVDAASYIDIDDPQWMYFICYEKYKDNDGNFQYATIGYTTVYKYYAFPQHIRPRISQMLVLPPFQKLGIATKFLETIYQKFMHDDNVIDITVEDPSEDFQRLRNFIDAKFCKNLPSFTPNKLKSGFSKDMIKEAKQNFKINGKQCRKVYEILRLYYTSLNNEDDYKNYRLDVKKRLHLSNYKDFKVIDHLEKSGINIDSLTAKLPPREERLEALQREYKIIEEDYLKIIEKLRETD